ncbi:MAG TPA: SpoIID/LytB domain-containing protein [Flavobacteriales bacterium]|nr:SpoIID/LytB domain-containing protein [Flavobacteriales bacterium]HNO04757.1 SpoIID/LytB domain-containing protein [Flavobacteriales bacterium]
MFRRPLILAFLLTIVHTCARAQERMIQAGIFRDRQLTQVIVRGTSSPIEVLIDGKPAGQVGSKDAVRISVQGDRLSASSLDRHFPHGRRITFRSTGRGLLRVGTGKPVIERDYPGSITISTANGALLVVNDVALDDYVAGVVQSEAGNHKGVEYYKLQAVSCRTYAITTARRHINEGFNLCDRTHCQVYKGACRLDSIKKAVRATKNLVVVDADIRPIHATFHSNCGGETTNAEDVWSKPESYLVSALDTFCLHEPHAQWRTDMPRTAWLTYLKDSFGLDTMNAATVEAVTSFDPRCRSLYLDGAHPSISLLKVRADLGLNSALFSIRTENGVVILDGRGFGHGVGLCQEGAMHMARLGIPFTDILHHYFAEVHLVDQGAIEFFKDE